MNREWERKIEEDYPFMSRECENIKDSPYSEWGFECESGWSDILREACEAITKKYADAGIPVVFVPEQIKEKFGSLRWYYSYTDAPCRIAAFDNLSDGTSIRVVPGNEDDNEEKKAFRKEIFEIIKAVEEKSKRVCEACGAPGTRRDSLPWIKTLCDGCEKVRVQACRRR